MTDRRLAELVALDSFEWIVEDFADPERILADTHAHYAPQITALKSSIAPDGDAAIVRLLILEGKPWACAPLGREAHRRPLI